MLKTNSLSTVIESYTYTNFIINSNFSNGTNDWNSNPAITTLSASGNTLSLTATGAAGFGNTWQDTNEAVDTSAKYYFRLKIRATNADCQNINIYYDGTTAGGEVVRLNISSPTANTWYDTGVVAQLPVTATGAVRYYIEHTYADAATATGKVVEVQEVLSINLTALYGSGNEPAQADCANIFKYVDGTKQPSLSKTIIT